MINFHPANPFRPCNWRWERARMLKEHRGRRRRNRPTEDFWTKRAHEFQVALERCRNDNDRYELYDEFEAVYGAYLVYRRGEDEDRHPMRYAIEARVLAGQTDLEIAEQVGVSELMVSNYVSLFFDVREKLKNTDYIITCVIGPSIHAGLSDRDYDLLWKLFGFLYGPKVLEAFIHTTSNRFRPEDSQGVEAQLAEDARSSLQRKVAVVARTYSINPFSQSELLNVYVRLLDIEKAAGQSESKDLILQNIQVMMEKLPWQAGEHKLAGAKDNSRLIELDNEATELRTTELLAVTTGNELSPETVEALEAPRFPEPKK